MNEKAIVKHFQARWSAEHGHIGIGRQGESYLAADGFVLLRLPLDHLLLDSRRVVPVFPADGQTMRYAKGAEPVLAEGNYGDIFKGWIDDPALVEVKATNWLKEYSGALYRAFELPDKRRVFVNEDFVGFLVGKDEAIEGYTFYSKPLPPTEDALPSAVIAHLDGEAVAALMPMRILEQGQLFAI